MDRPYAQSTISKLLKSPQTAPYGVAKRIKMLAYRGLNGAFSAFSTRPGVHRRLFQQPAGARNYQRRTQNTVWAFIAVLGMLWTAGVHAASPEPPSAELRALVKQAVHDGSSFKDRYLGQVWLMDMSNRLASRMPNPKQRLQLLRLVHNEAARVHLAPELVLAVIDVESRFDRFAISSAGARGLMQVMPFWLKEIGRPNDNLFHVRTNLRIGCTILRYYVDKAKGDLRQALARYNGSSGQRWYSDRVFDALSRRWFHQ